MKFCEVGIVGALVGGVRVPKVQYVDLVEDRDLRRGPRRGAGQRRHGDEHDVRDDVGGVVDGVHTERVRAARSEAQTRVSDRRGGHQIGHERAGGVRVLDDVAARRGVERQRRPVEAEKSRVKNGGRKSKALCLRRGGTHNKNRNQHRYNTLQQRQRQPQPPMRRTQACHVSWREVGG